MPRSPRNIREKILIGVVTCACAIPWLSFLSDRVYSYAWNLQLSAATGAFSVRNTVAPVEMIFHRNSGESYKTSLRRWRLQMADEVHLVSLVIQSTFLRYAQTTEGKVPFWVKANLDYLVCQNPNMALPFVPFAPDALTTRMVKIEDDPESANERNFRCPSAP